MGQITIDEMHNSLFDYAQAVSDENLITESKTVVGAINEIYGKKLIANAIGEPLNSTDTYAKMNNDINSLLSTFKTNMMNAGTVVESGDKFKQLIDKIKGLTELSGGLDIISATKLPATGRENQICVITDNPIDNFLITTNFNDTQSTSAIGIYLGDPEDVLPSSALTITKGNITNIYYFNRVCQQNKRLASYHYANNQWNLLTRATIPVYENNSFPSEDVLGVSPVKNSGSTVYISGNEIYFSTSDYAIRGFTFPNIIDFSSYHKVTIVARLLSGSNNGNLYVASMKKHHTSVINISTNKLTDTHAYSWVNKAVSSVTEAVLTYDISSFTGSGYLGIIAGGSNSTFYVQEIILE